MSGNSNPPRSWCCLLGLLIVLVAATFGVLTSWQAPGLNQYAYDWLLRARGPLTPPNDIAIIAIDETSVAHYGRFPWPRSLVASVVDAVAKQHPKAIALDILYSEPSANPADDEALAASIKRAGNTVAAAELTRAHAGAAVWLRPIPLVEDALAGVGHVNIMAESDGVARQMLVQQSDDEGQPFWSMAIEVVRVGEGAAADSIRQERNTIRVGSHAIPVRAIEIPLAVESRETKRVRTLVPQQMLIDFIGPAGSFKPYTISVLDLLTHGVAPSQLAGKYVLIGMTAASLGDRIASPFPHKEEGAERSSLMPGVEVLANCVNTILRNSYYWVMPEWLVVLVSAMVAGLVVLAFSIEYPKIEAVKQLASLAIILGTIILTAYLLFAHWLIVLPLVPTVVTFFWAAPLALVRRGMIASAGLDDRIRELLHAQDWLWPEPNALQGPDPTTSAAGWYPQRLQWKTRTLGALNRKLLDRARFVDCAMRSVEDGLLVANVQGRVIFANRRAVEILITPEKLLLGSDLLGRLFSEDVAAQALETLFRKRIPVERQIVWGPSEVRHYSVRLSPVLDPGQENNEAIGMVCSLSDITKQHQLNEMKSNVMALVTHELRTPLTAIQGMSEVLTQFDVDEKRRNEMLTAVNSEAKRLGRLIDDYLDITKIESGARPLRLIPTLLEPVVSRAVFLLDPVAAQRGIVLVKQFTSTSPLALADSDLLTRALTNLLGNAIKFSPPRTTVTVTIREVGRDVFIDVTDQGVGVPAGDLDRIFEKFYRVHRSEPADTPGTGLGLAMVREIMELHRGSVSVASVPKEGSIFSLRLPQLAAVDQNGGQSPHA
jgi:signal transduction histidine kinase/CHASE2 domain-containing sensor protein